MKKRGSSFLVGLVIFIISLVYNVPSETDVGQEALEGISQSSLCNEQCVNNIQFMKFMLFFVGIVVMVGTVISLSKPVVRWFQK